MGAAREPGGWVTGNGVTLPLGLFIQADRGFYLHLSANLAGPSGWWENFLYGAPIFTPLLFPNLAVLAVLGLMVFARETPEERRPLPAGPLPVDHASCH